MSELDVEKSVIVYACIDLFGYFDSSEPWGKKIWSKRSIRAFLITFSLTRVDISALL